MVTSESVETYPHGTIRQWLDEGRIALIVGTGAMSRAVIDEWAELVIRTLHEWPADRPIFILNDLTAESQGITPYARERAEDTYKAMPSNNMVYSAVALRPGIVNQLISIFIRRTRGTSGKARERVFTSRQDGLNWLHEMMKHHQPHI